MVSDNLFINANRYVKRTTILKIWKNGSRGLLRVKLSPNMKIILFVLASIYATLNKVQYV